MKARKTSFINLMKVLGALVKPNGITNHSYKPNLVLNAVFHSSPNFIRIWLMLTSLLLIQPLYLQLHTYKDPSQDLVPNNLTIRYFRFLELFLIYMRI